MAKKFERVSHNPLLNRLHNKGKQGVAYHASAKLEKRVAKETGGRRTSGSGNQREKGDVRIRGVARLEHKATVKDSFRVTKNMLKKIENSAIANGEVPALVVSFLDEHGNIIDELAVIPYQSLKVLINNVED